jgi:ABC-type transport system involved in multi-copper enzyme maturation permease subunit
MASNRSFVAVKDRGWLNGFANMFRKENHAWWGTWQWVIQVVIWLAIVNGMLAMVALAAPKIEAAHQTQEISAEEAAAAASAIDQTALMVFFVFSGLAPAVGVVILAQDALIGEKQAGTAAWVFSKPVSRVAFLLSKLSADALGILATMVIIQGVVAYAVIKIGTANSLPLSGYLAALGLVFLLLTFYLSLTYMLGTLFSKRGAVIGIPVVLVFGNQLTGILPWLGKILPWNLVMDLGPAQPALAVALAQGQPLPTVTPVIGTAVLTIVFLVVALWRFQREEF